MEHTAVIDIAEVTKQTGLPASTLRFYEEKGLIKSIGRRGLRRLFHYSVVEHLALISLGRSAGFSLEEITGMFAADGRLQIDRDQIFAKADELDRTIINLTVLRDNLRHAAECPAPSHLECSTFKKLMRVAQRNTRKRRIK